MSNLDTKGRAHVQRLLTRKKFVGPRAPQRAEAVASRGDTIVEVLIAISILSLIITSAFALTRRNSTTIQDTQERAAMLQVLRTQTELLRRHAVKETAATPPSDSVFAHNGTGSAPKYFCMNTSGSGLVNFAAATTMLTAGMAEYPAGCVIDSLYHVAITLDQPRNTFIVQGNWDRAGGGMNMEQLRYRIARNF